MKHLKYIEIREKYLDILKKQFNHAIIPSATLVTEDDPTLLFVNAGMVPLVPYLLGETHPEGTRLANSQRSVRTIDINTVGDKTHVTAFEMLGNWSLNDYFKEEAIKITLGFITKELGIPYKDLYFSVFSGDDDAPEDSESIRVYKEIYKELGLDYEIGLQKRIATFGKKENWWGLPAGGPCGPNTEIFYDTGADYCSKNCSVACDCGKFIELGNNVFMEYFNTNNIFKPLGRHNVDFGGGLDRLAMISQEVKDVYHVDIYKPIYDKVLELAKLTEEIATEEQVISLRIIVDHIKAATWMIMDEITPGRSEREYILRMIIRRAIRHAHKLNIENNFVEEIAIIAIEQFKVVWPKLETDKDRILSTLIEEEIKFNKTLMNGLKEVQKLIDSLKIDNRNSFNNEDASSFKIFETYGFPPEMLIEELQNNEITVDEEKFLTKHNEAFKKHQDLSRAGSAGKFKGGLADTSEESIKLHTATHLLLAALRKVVGNHIYQKGSNITTERLRLDFPNDSKLTPEQVTEVEKLVNDAIKADLPITWKEFDKKEAMKLVPFAAFNDKYGDRVKVYFAGDPDNAFSTEICGGPHVKSTAMLGSFKIKKQDNVGAGIKRIKAAVS